MKEINENTPVHVYYCKCGKSIQCATNPIALGEIKNGGDRNTRKEFKQAELWGRKVEVLTLEEFHKIPFMCNGVLDCPKLEMIKANELRIGNYVHMIERGFDTINTIQVYQIKKMTQGWYINTHSHENISGIPLTPELLIKCGFLKFNYSEVETFNKEMFEFHLDSMWWWCLNEGVNLSSVQYLHQLQNLYFAITSEELQVNL